MKQDRNILELTEILGRSIADQHLDANLRRIYSDMLGEPLPDKFALLLDQLREKGGSTTH